jgi:hypothetical protein
VTLEIKGDIAFNKALRQTALSTVAGFVDIKHYIHYVLNTRELSVKTEENLVDLSHGRFSVASCGVFGMKRTTSRLVPALLKVQSISRKRFPRVEHDLAVPRLSKQLLSVSKCGRA